MNSCYNDKILSRKVGRLGPPQPSRFWRPCTCRGGGSWDIPGMSSVVPRYVLGQLGPGTTRRGGGSWDIPGISSVVPRYILGQLGPGTTCRGGGSWDIPGMSSVVPRYILGQLGPGTTCRGGWELRHSWDVLSCP